MKSIPSNENIQSTNEKIKNETKADTKTDPKNDNKNLIDVNKIKKEKEKEKKEEKVFANIKEVDVKELLAFGYESLGLNDDIFENVTTFIKPDVANKKHHVIIPREVFTSDQIANIVSSENYIELKTEFIVQRAANKAVPVVYACDEHKIQVVARKDFFRHVNLYERQDKDFLIAFYCNLYGAVKPEKKWVGTMKYEVLYIACRAVALFFGWIGAHKNAEWSLAPERVTKLKFSLELAQEVVKHLDMAKDLLIAVALNWYMTNHNVGQGGITNFLIKTIRLLQIVPLMTPDADIRTMTSDIYNAVHFSDKRNILWSVMATRADRQLLKSARCVPGLPIPDQFILDDFIVYRVLSAPAGVGAISFAYGVLTQIGNNPLILMLENVGLVKEVHMLMEKIMDNSWSYHVGANYLNSNKMKIFNKISINAESFKPLCLELVSYIYELQPNSSLAKSSTYTKYVAECESIKFGLTAKEFHGKIVVSEKVKQFIQSQYGMNTKVLEDIEKADVTNEAVVIDLRKKLVKLVKDLMPKEKINENFVSEEGLNSAINYEKLAIANDYDSPEDDGEEHNPEDTMGLENVKGTFIGTNQIEPELVNNLVNSNIGASEDNTIKNEPKKTVDTDVNKTADSKDKKDQENDKSIVPSNEKTEDKKIEKAEGKDTNDSKELKDTLMAELVEDNKGDGNDDPK